MRELREGPPSDVCVIAFLGAALNPCAGAPPRAQPLPPHTRHTKPRRRAMQRTLLPPPSPSGAAQLSRRTAVTAGLVSILPVLRPDLARANPVSPDSPAYQAISPQGPTFPKPLPDVSEIYAEYKYARPLDVLPFGKPDRTRHEGSQPQTLTASSQVSIVHIQT